MLNSIGECMKERDDREIIVRKRVRVRMRVLGEKKKEITVFKVALVLLGATAAGIIIGMVLNNLLTGRGKTDHDPDQVPASFSSPSPAASVPVLSPGIKD